MSQSRIGKITCYRKTKNYINANREIRTFKFK